MSSILSCSWCLQLVGGLEHEFYDSPFSWEFHHPKWRTHIFQRDYTHMLHGAVICTYKTGWFLGPMLVNLLYMEHMGYGCFLKWRYPQLSSIYRGIFHLKQSILIHFGVPPFMEAPVRCVKMTLSWYEMTHESHCRYTNVYVDIVWNIKLISCKNNGWMVWSFDGRGTWNGLEENVFDPYWTIV